MANEAVLIIEKELPISMTCADGTGIEKGAVLKMSDPFTAAISAADNDVIAGICAGEKIASDGCTDVAVYPRGVFKMVASGSITVGDPVASAASTGANKVFTASVNVENILGVALETATNGETLLIELKPTTMQLA